MPKRPEKLKDLMATVRKLTDTGRLADTRHASERKNDRKITRLEIFQVINRGHHEKSKDDFDEQNGEWKYAIRGKTVDKRDLRIIVKVIVELNVVVITAINI